MTKPPSSIFRLPPMAIAPGPAASEIHPRCFHEFHSAKSGRRANGGKAGNDEGNKGGGGTALAEGNLDSKHGLLALHLIIRLHELFPDVNEPFRGIHERGTFGYPFSIAYDIDPLSHAPNRLYHWQVINVADE
jgi:hypothetical protein